MISKSYLIRQSFYGYTVEKLEFSFLHKGSLELKRTVPLILHVQSLYYAYSPFNITRTVPLILHVQFL